MTAEPHVAPILVSVIVPVFEPGPELELCLDSITGQSLDPQSYELIIVDDGSGPDTAAQLDRLSDLLPHTVLLHTVLHGGHAGWAGPLRNAGLRGARGEFVIFVDPDDRLNPETLERLHGTARRNAADVVLGKLGGTLAEPSALFAVNRDRCSLVDAPLLQSLTVHHLFRRSFLLQQGIEFGPEPGLADARFMITAYLRATTVSIIGDYVCYRWLRRDDDSFASLLDATPAAAYFDAVGALLQLVVDETEPGELRNQTLAHLFGAELMSRLREPTVLRLSPNDLEMATARVHALAAEFVEPTAGVLDGLATITRLQTRLVLIDRSDSLLLLARRQHGDVRARPSVTRQRIDKGVLEIEVACELRHRDGSPVTLHRRDGRFLLDPSLTVGLEGLDAGGWPVGDPLSGAELAILVRDEHEQSAWFPPMQVHPALEHLEADRYKIVLAARARIDPRRLGPGLAAGTYVISSSTQMLGYSFADGLNLRTGPLELEVDDHGQVVDPTPHSFPGPLRTARALAERILPTAVTKLALRGTRSVLRRARKLR